MPSLLLNPLETFLANEFRLLCPRNRMLFAKLVLLLMPRRGVAGMLVGMVLYPLPIMSGWSSNPVLSLSCCERDMAGLRRSE
jgi:hypothetical protein